jgi:hypothetical protein
MTAVRKLTSLGLCVAGAVALLSAGPAQAQQATMSFFVSSVGGGKGADFGGLAGADKHCQTLAAAVGAGSKTWHAYLSTQGDGAVNARDRIGKGPWSNAKGVVIAKDVAELHGTNNLTKETALTEKAGGVNGYGDRPNQHDILTGSQRDGTAFPPDKAPCSAIRIAKGRAKTTPCIPGTPRIRRGDRKADAVKPICRPLAAPGCSTASR